MSASEKLRALEEGFATPDRVYVVLNALPQIRAVAEAARRMYEHVEQTFPEGVAVDPVFREYDAADAALDEVLSK